MHLGLNSSPNISHFEELFINLRPKIANEKIFKRNKSLCSFLKNNEIDPSVLKPGFLVCVHDPKYYKDVAQIIDINYNSGRVLLKMIPRINYRDIKAFKVKTQSALNCLLGPDDTIPLNFFEKDSFTSEQKQAKIKISWVKDGYVDAIHYDGEKYIGKFLYKKFEFSEIFTSKIQNEKIYIFKSNLADFEENDSNFMKNFLAFIKINDSSFYFDSPSELSSSDLDNSPSENEMLNLNKMSNEIEKSQAKNKSTKESNENKKSPKISKTNSFIFDEKTQPNTKFNLIEETSKVLLNDKHIKKHKKMNSEEPPDIKLSKSQNQINQTIEKVANNTYSNSNEQNQTSNNKISRSQSQATPSIIIPNQYQTSCEKQKAIQNSQTQKHDKQSSSNIKTVNSRFVLNDSNSLFYHQSEPNKTQIAKFQTPTVFTEHIDNNQPKKINNNYNQYDKIIPSTGKSNIEQIPNERQSNKQTNENSIDLTKNRDSMLIDDKNKINLINDSSSIQKSETKDSIITIQQNVSNNSLQKLEKTENNKNINRYQTDIYNERDNLIKEIDSDDKNVTRKYEYLERKRNDYDTEPREIDFRTYYRENERFDKYRYHERDDIYDRDRNIYERGNDRCIDKDLDYYRYRDYRTERERNYYRYGYLYEDNGYYRDSYYRKDDEYYRDKYYDREDSYYRDRYYDKERSHCYRGRYRNDYY